MDTIRELLDHKGSQVHTVQPDTTVLDAIREMADRDIGCLIVADGDRPVGIFTERHYARNVFLRGKHSPTTAIREIMDRDVVCVSPAETVDQCLAVMTDKRIRHLPVLEDNKLVGIVSISDLVRARIADQEFMIEQLGQYIYG